MYRTIPVVSLIVLSMASSVTSAQDWPQWRGANRDGKVSGFIAPSEWPDTLKQNWSISVGLGDASPIVAGDRLYVFTRQGGEEVVLCLNKNDGKQIWRNAYEAEAISGPDAREHSGPRSTPVVAEGKIVTLGVVGDLSCLDAETGEVVWRKKDYPNSYPKFHIAMSPIIVDGKCIAHLGKEDQGAVVAYDLVTGEPKWKWDSDGPAYASPVLMSVDGGKQLVVQASENLVGLSLADGKLLWEVSTPVQGRFFYNSATPIVDGSTVFFTGQGSGTKAIAIAKQDQEYVVKDLWSNQDMGTSYNTPVLRDGRLYGLSVSGRDGSLFCLDAKTGKTLWTDTNRYPTFCSVLDLGSALLALPSSADLIFYRPDGESYEELAKYKVSETAVYAHPLVMGNVIFVKDRENLIRYSLQ